jgi:prepilin-type N-terminal cleavage/methylation domain-containing protein
VRLAKAFTLIELLVVIIIIGTLSAIALPNFLNQASKARESEAKATVVTLNRTQQAWQPLRNNWEPISSEDLLEDRGIFIQKPGAPIRLESMESVAQRADDFSGLTEAIHGVYWTGVDGIGDSYCWRLTNIFEISFYHDNNGLPGDLVQSHELTATSSKWEQIFGDDNPFAIVNRYTVDLPEPLSLAAGWVSIRAMGDWECVWGWGLDDGSAAQSGSGSAKTDDGVEWVKEAGLNMSFTLIGPGDAAVAASRQPATITSDAGTAQGESVVESEIINDIAQAGWIASILVGDTYLSSADQAIVKGSAGGGGFLGNQAILKDPEFVAAVTDALAEANGVPQLVAQPVAEGFTSLWAYWMSIDHHFWLDFYAATELGPVFDAFDAANRLNSDAGTILGASADPDNDGKNNKEEWELAVASGQALYALVARFVDNAERVPAEFRNGFETPPPFPDLAAIGPSVDATSVAPDGDLTISAIAYNLGGVISAASTLRFFLSNTLLITPDDVELGSVSIDGLSSGEQSAGVLPVTLDAGLGPYWVGACIDPVAGETGLDNQCSAGVGIRVTGPDLTITDPAVGDDMLTPGESFTITATARNIGAVGSASTTTNYRLSSDDVIDNSDAFLGSSEIPAMAAGDSSPQGLAGALAPSASGEYWVGACAEVLPDETETANQCSTAVPIQVLGPDLLVFNPGVSKSTLQPSEAFSIGATVGNDSQAPSSSSTIRFYLSTDSNITTGDTQIITRTVAPLAGGATSGFNLETSAPSVSRFYYVGACVDTVENELITDNQCSSGVAIEVTKPDLTVIEPSVSSGLVFSGNTYTIFATAKNIGVAASIPRTMNYYMSSDDRIEAQDTWIGQDAVGALAPDGASAQNIDVTAPFPGSYYVGACMEVDENESNKTNQCSTGVLLTVVPGG